MRPLLLLPLHAAAQAAGAGTNVGGFVGRRYRRDPRLGPYSRRNGTRFAHSMVAVWCRTESSTVSGGLKRCVDVRREG
jgi:hypothetical protein